MFFLEASKQAGRQKQVTAYKDIHNQPQSGTSKQASKQAGSQAGRQAKQAGQASKHPHSQKNVLCLKNIFL